jgi:hypothetical protein
MDENCGWTGLDWIRVVDHASGSPTMGKLILLNTCTDAKICTLQKKHVKNNLQEPPEQGDSEKM